MIAFVLFVPIGSSFRLVSTAIVAETEKSPSSFSPSRDLFSPTAHWPRSLLGIIYPRNFRDKGGFVFTAPHGGATIILSPAENAEGAGKGGQVSMMDIGLLLNFGMNTMKEGIVRAVNNDPPSASSAVSAGDKNKVKGSRSVKRCSRVAREMEMW